MRGEPSTGRPLVVASSLGVDGCGPGGECVPNGVYFCRISTPSDEAVCTMLLLR